MKPESLTKCLINPTWINSYLIKKLEVDLKHINFGLDFSKGYAKNNRSNFTIEEIAQFFESLDQIEMNSELEAEWEYFVIDKKFFNKNKKYRIVFCIDKRQPDVSGIITFYRIKRSSK
jgi:hypothetical protein